MENKDKIYEQFKAAATKAEDKSFARMDAVWNRVEEKLDNKKERRAAIWWRYTGIAALFLLFMGVGTFMLNHNDPAVSPQLSPQNKVTVVDTQEVKETFRPEKQLLPVNKEAVVTNPGVKTPYATTAVTIVPAQSDRATASPATSTGDASAETADNSTAAITPAKHGPDPIIITGTVVDAQGMPVPGVNVTVKNTKKGTQTDLDGLYQIYVDPGDVLSFQYVNMLPESVVITGKKTRLDITMKDDATTLDAVVVEAYRTTSKAMSNIASATITSKTVEARGLSGREKRKKEAKNNAVAQAAQSSASMAGSATGDIDTNPNNAVSYRDGDKRVSDSSRASKTIESRTNASFVQTLQGQAAGLNIATGSGQPGATNTVAIRGAGSVNNNTGPLYIIDGVPYNADNLSKISPAYIESVTVLKDANAAAVYGNRAANGVILVKTKKLSRKERKELNKVLKENQPATGAVTPQKSEIIPFRPVQNRNTRAVITPKSEIAPTGKIAIDQEEYEAFEENKFENPATAPLSTFSIDVDNASYTNVRRFLNNGQTVPKDAVRVEEMINFFKYNYPQPAGNDPFSITTEYSDAPWNPDHKLLKIGLQGKDIASADLPASNFVFLIDVSGSMSDVNKLPLLKQSMKVLINQMRPKDHIAIVVYAGAAGLVLPSTSGAEKSTILAALDNLSAGGSTAGGAGIELAYKTAQENFVKKGNNRIILATDGDFNVGASSDKDMQTLIEEKRKSGIFLTCLGYGMGNYKDSKLETLSDKGNGNYAYIDNMQEADRFLSKEFKGSMYAIAKDVKIQIEFNPKLVQSYRLIGYENRKLRDEDFANDAIDAGELGSGHTVTALYEIIPVGVKSGYFNAAPELKYSLPKVTEGNGNYSNELATIKFRYKKPDGDKSTEIVNVIPNTTLPLSGTSGDFKFAAAVAWFGLKLRDSKLVPDKTSDTIKELAKQGLQNDPDGYRAEFIRMVQMVE